jgi:Uma2 family endonuclease
MSMLYSESMPYTADGPQRHRYTVADYHRMGETGILAPDARVELIDGEIVDMPPIGFRHAGTVDHLAHILMTACAGHAIVRVQSSIQLGDYSEPQPDVCLLRPRADFYTTSPVPPGDVLLVIEVAGTSQRYDRVIKLPLYAHHGIAEVWLIDLESARLTRCRQPQAGRYAVVDEPTLAAPLVIAASPEVAVDLAGVFG